MKVTKGKKTKPVEQADHVCPVCEEQAFDALAELPTQDYAGTLPNGQSYTTIRRQRVRCRDCGQVSIKRLYA